MAKTQNGSLRRRQLGKKLNPFRKLVPNIPAEGWTKVIRDAIGMTGTQLARRIGCTAATLANIEKREGEGRTTLRTLRGVAKGLECEFVYAFVPKLSLEQMVRDQAFHVARRRVKRVARSMALESQQTSRSEEEFLIKEIAEQLVRGLPRELWSDE